MIKRSLGSYQVEIDLEATRQWYAQAEEWDCECGHCRNFIRLAKQRMLPEHLLALLDELGIPPEKPTYVCWLYENEEGLLYEYQYRLVGCILSGPEKGGEEIKCFHEPYPYGAPGFPKMNFDLTFFSTVPWVLEEPQN